MIKKLLSPWTALITLTILILIRFTDPSFVESIRLRYFDSLIVGQVTQSKQIHVVDIDEETIKKFGQFPFPREKYGQIIESLYQRGAGLVVFNIYMPDPDRFGQDDKLARTLKKYPVVLPQVGGTTKPSYEPFRPGVSVIGGESAGVNYETIEPNVKALNDVAAGIGVSNTLPEIDGVTRRIPMVVQSNGKMYPSISLETLRVASGEPSFQVKLTDYGIEAVRIKQLGKITTDPLGRIWIDWSKEPVRHSYAKLPQNFNGAIVIVGLTAKGLNNPVATAIGSVYPHHLQAAVLDTVVGGVNIQRPDWANGAEILFIAVIGLLIIFFTRWTYAGIAFVLIAAVGVFGGSKYLFVHNQYLLDVTFAEVAISLIAIHAYVIKFVSEFLQKQQIKKQFQSYLSPDLVAKLQRQPDLLRLGGEEQPLTIMFTDVRGFTAISEHYGKDVQGLTKIMNRYMTAMTKRILENNGTLDKYIGDAQMAFWNAPVPNPNHAKDAVKTAIQMLEDLDEFNKEISTEGVPAFGMGLGINSGTVVVGNMGSDQRFDYTCLGDAVNLASRLEGQSKNYGVKIVIGQEAAKLIKDDYDLFELDTIAVKGKTEGIKIYTIGKQTEAQNVFLYWYREGVWDEAINVCKMEKFRNVEMTEYYELMMQRLLEGKPEKWDGVYRATSK